MLSNGVPASEVDFVLLPLKRTKWTKHFSSDVPSKLISRSIYSRVFIPENTSTKSVLELIEQSNSEWVSLLNTEVDIDFSVFADLFHVINQDKSVDVVYTDSHIESKAEGSFTGERPDFSPELLRSQNYLGPLVLFRSQAIISLLKMAPEIGTDALLYWLALAATRAQFQISHFSVFAYREPSETNLFGAQDLAEISNVVAEHLELTGGGLIRKVLPSGTVLSSRSLIDTPLVSIVIPTRGIYTEINGQVQCLVLDAVRSIVDNTDYDHYELVIVVDSVAEQAVLDQLMQIAPEKISFAYWDKPFNFSQKMNFGVLHARGSYVLLLNDDVKVISNEWLGSMLSLAQLPNAGMVGAMLYYDDDSIQHAGHAYYLGSPTHIGLGLPRGTHGHNQSFLVEREVSGVTAACALMPKEVFMDVGGFSPLLPGNFNDVDLCLKTGWKGYQIYWTPFAELYHFESKTREAHVHYYELDVIENRWGLKLDDQRYWRGHPWRKS